MANLSARVLCPELLDQGRASDDEVRRSLLDLRRINRLFGGRRVLLETLAQEVSRYGIARFSVLDIASSSGDLPLAILDWAQQQQLETQVFALEYWHRHLALFQSDFKGRPHLHPICADVFHAPFPDRAFDFVTCCLFLHHLTEGQAIALLSSMRRWARCAIIVIDLERRPFPYYFFRLFSRAFTTSVVSRRDGVTSFKQCFRKEELERIAKQAGLERCTVERRWPFRLLLISEMSGKMDDALSCRSDAARPGEDYLVEEIKR